MCFMINIWPLDLKTEGFNDYSPAPVDVDLFSSEIFCQLLYPKLCPINPTLRQYPIHPKQKEVWAPACIIHVLPQSPRDSRNIVSNYWLTMPVSDTGSLVIAEQTNSPSNQSRFQSWINWPVCNQSGWPVYSWSGWSVCNQSGWHVCSGSGWNIGSQSGGPDCI